MACETAVFWGDTADRPAIGRKSRWQDVGPRAATPHLGTDHVLEGLPSPSPWGFGFVTPAVPLGSCHRSHGHELKAPSAALSLLARSQNRTCKFACVQPCAQFAAGGVAGGPSAHAGLDRGSRCFAVSSDRQPEHRGAVLCCAVLDATLFCSPPQVL